MPRPEEKPPNKRVDDLITKITLEYWEKFKHLPSKSKDDLHKRDSEMITALIKELAIEKAKNEILSK